MTLQVFTLREPPELRPVIFGAKFGPAIWPEYMMCDPVASLYFSPPFLDQYLDYVLIGVEGTDVVARGFSVPFAFSIPGREELPDGGWDEVIRWAHHKEDVREVGRCSSGWSIVPNLHLLRTGLWSVCRARHLGSPRSLIRVRQSTEIVGVRRP